MCRAIPMDFEKNIKLNGVTGLRYTAGGRALDNGTLYDENKCFASNGEMPAGLINITACNYEFPLFTSFPHFYGSDKSYLGAVEGLSPEKEKHESFITLEPETGITLEILARFQSNMLIKQYSDYIPLYQKVPHIVMLIFWVEQKFIMDKDKTSRLKLALDVPFFMRLVGALLLLSGVAMLFISQLRKLFCSKEKAKNLISKFEVNEHNAVIKEADPLMKKINDF